MQSTAPKDLSVAVMLADNEGSSFARPDPLQLMVFRIGCLRPDTRPQDMLFHLKECNCDVFGRLCVRSSHIVLKLDVMDSPIFHVRYC